MTAIAFNGARNEAARIIRAILASLTGHDRSEAARAVFIAMGIAALTEIHQDFITKARGGVGADGTVWPRLSPKTLAYHRRFGPGEQSALKQAAGLGRGNRHAPGGKSGLLSAAELKQWRQIYASRLAKFAQSMPLSEAKAKAAAIAWATMKARGAKTKLEVYGHREHEVLRDTGILANSLSVGMISGDSYQRPMVDGGDQQVFNLLSNGVIVGTNVKYARAHDQGLNGLPRRPIIPDESKIPQAWLDHILDAAMRALATAIEYSISRGSVA